MPAKKMTMAETLAELRAKSKLEIGPLGGFDMNYVGNSTGNIALDHITGVGGYPQGGIVEQFGPPSSGKTTAALQSLARLQQRIIAGEVKGYVGFWDYEKSLDEVYCRNLGLDVDDQSFIYLQPTSFEHGANIYRRLIGTNEMRACVFDSVAAMVTENELAAQTGEAKVADRAKMMHQFLRQVHDPVHRTGTSLIFLNHHLELIDSSPMGQKLSRQGVKRMYQPGGKALGFYARLRIEFKQIGNIRTSEVDTLTGQKDAQIRQTKVQATVVKNKVGDPFGTAVLRVRWGRGFSQAYSVLSILESYGVVKKDGAGQYYFGRDELTEKRWEALSLKKKTDVLKIKGEETALQAIEADPEWQALLEGRAQALLDQHGGDTVDGSIYDSDGNVPDFDEILSTDDDTGELL